MNNQNTLDLFSNKGQGGDAYDKYRPPYPQHMIDKLLEFSDGKKTYLDIATGTGQIFLRIYDRFPNLAVANDLSSLQLSILEENINNQPNISTPTKVLCCDALDIKKHIPDQKYDFITIAAAFHWFDQDKLMEYIKAELLSENGVLVVLGYVFGDYHYKTEDKEFNLTANDRFLDYLEIVLANYPYRGRVDMAMDRLRSYDFKKYFSNVVHEEWTMSRAVIVEDFKGRVKTWSVYPYYVKENEGKSGYCDPVDLLVGKMASDLGTEDFSVDEVPTYYYYMM
jgi:16S rRNA G966 N2-methylase RsmD